MADTTSQELTRNLFHLMKQFPRLKLIHTPGLTRGEQELIVTLAMSLNESKRSLIVSEISSLLQITPAGVTHLLNTLEDAGFIERLSDSRDRRIVRIALTVKGTKEADEIIMEIHAKAVELVGLLGEEESITFFRLLSRVVQHFSSRPGNQS